MNPDSILRADIIDIIFENRNKEYGAYELRTRYDRRLKNAVMIMISSVSIFCAILYVDANFFDHRLYAITPYHIADVNISKALDSKPQELIKPKSAQPVRTQIATIRNVTLRIVQDKLAMKPPPTVEELISKQIGPDTKPGELAGNVVPVTPSGNDQGNATEPKQETNEPVIYKTAEFMPEFPGGPEALQRFLAKNMRVPRDLEPGSRIKVLEKFVVDEQGNITGLQTIQSGGTEFDNEVLRVLKKMPKWKPGRQNGRNVSVYFNLPVIFQSQDDN